MTWEVFRRGGWWLLGAILAANALPILILTALEMDGAIDVADHAMLVIHVAMVQINAVVFGAALLNAQGHPSRVYTFPIPAATLAFWQLTPAMLLVGLEIAASTALLDQLFKLNWPLWGPALFIAVGLASVQSLFWLTEKSVWIVVGLAAVGGVLGTWFMSRYGLVFSGTPHPWQFITPVDMLFLLTVAVGAYAVAVVAIKKARCGEALNSQKLREWFDRLFDPAPAHGLPFRDAEQAQFWFEWRRKGVMPAMTVFGMVLGLSGWLLFSHRMSKELYEAVLGGGAILPIGGFIVGLIVGSVGPTDGRFEMGNFLATRPMSDAAMARLILKTAGRNVFLGWLFWIAGFAFVFLLLWALKSLPDELMLPKLGWWYFPGLLAASWLTTAVAAVVVLAGRAALALWLSCGVPGILIGLTLLSRYALSPAEQQAFGHGALVVASVALVLGTCWFFRMALRRRMVGLKAAHFALGLWSVSGAAVMVHWSLAPAAALSAYIFIVGLCALALAPLAAAPLAVSWNRHR
jgi:hypothetical protein